MKYKIIKFRFDEGIYRANGIVTDIPKEISSLTIMTEVLREENKNLKECINSGEFSISDCYPYFNDIMLISKPLFSVQNVKSQDTVKRKKIKIIDFIPLSDVNEYFHGTTDFECIKKICDSLGIFQFDKNGSCFKFSEKAGLYIIVRFAEDEVFSTFHEIVKKCAKKIFNVNTVLVECIDVDEKITKLFEGKSCGLLLNTFIPDLKAHGEIDENDSYEFGVSPNSLNKEHVFFGGSFFNKLFNKKENSCCCSPIYVCISK